MSNSSINLEPTFRVAMDRPTKFKDLIRVFVRGGIISPGDLLKVIQVAEKMGTDYIHLGSRQDILFPVKEKDLSLIESTFKAIELDFEINNFSYQNISSSYVSLDLQPKKPWMASHVYHYILESFEYLPKLRINIVDPSQSLVPLFTGHINFLASNQESFWYLYLRFSEIQESPWQAPILIYGEDISNLCKLIEQKKSEENFTQYTDLVELITESGFRTQPVTEELVFPDTNFPYYEGINRMQDDKYWLGLYWRDNKFSIGILKAICMRCLNTEVGKISLTPWKSFVIKGIAEKYRIGWEKLMGRSGMNLRHSSLELNWHLPALDQEAYDLKTQLVRILDQQDMSTYGLTFTIKTTDDITLFTSIVVEKADKSSDIFNVLYSKDFNPNLTEYYCYAQGVPRDVLPSLLIELSRLYYEQLEETHEHEDIDQHIQESDLNQVYQCRSCLTEYNPKYGDIQQGVPKNTWFDDLQDDYHCPLCGEPKKNFKLK